MPDSRFPSTVRLHKTVRLPDHERLALWRASPGLGPRILFFSGGSALRELSEKLVEYTHHSIHCITPFDSGGSSAELRRAFGMPAVGDIRSRIMALADRTLRGNHEIYALFATRLDKAGAPEATRRRLDALCAGDDPLMRAVPDPMRAIIRRHLLTFADRMPADFDLRGASIGNCILAGGYLDHDRQLDPVIYLFSKLVEARGVVRPVVDDDLQLVATLADGTVLVGQHRLTGKETPPIRSRVVGLGLTRDPATAAPATVRIRPEMERLIASADLICFPMGSFYSSLIANLLPEGVAEAVVQNPAPKVFVPGTGIDPEQYGLTVAQSVETLRHTLLAGLGRPCPAGDALHFVLVDSARGVYPGGLDPEAIAALGLRVIDAPLACAVGRTELDGRAVIEHLLSLA